MVITILEARVDADKTAILEEVFRQGIEHLDAGIERTYLVKAAKDPNLWRIVTFWESRAALDAMRSSGETPRGVVMFRAAGAEPVLSVFDVVAHSAPV